MTRTSLQATCKTAKFLKLIGAVSILVGIGGMTQRASFEFVRNAIGGGLVVYGLGTVVQWFRND